MEEGGGGSGQDADHGGSQYADDDVATMDDSDATVVDEDHDDVRSHQDDVVDAAAAGGVVLARAPTSPPASMDIVKVSVTVKDKAQLLELSQAMPLQDVCRLLCAEHGLTWRPNHYALTTVKDNRVKSKSAAHFASHKYISEENRHDLAHGAELTLAYAADVFCSHILSRLSDRTKPEEWSRALLQLAELAEDATFIAEFASRRGAVALVLGLLLATKEQRLRNREKVWALWVVLCLVRHGTLTGQESVLPELVVALCMLVRSEHAVDGEVLEASLRLLTAVSNESWMLSPVPHLSPVDLVALLWDPTKPGAQVAALELMNALAARESRLGPDSPEGQRQVTRDITSNMVCTTIAKNVLNGHVRSNMARQLFQLQTLILQPLKKAMETRASSATKPMDPLVLPRPPPRLQRRKPTTAVRAQSRSWCVDEDKEAPRDVGDRRSFEEESPYKLLSGNPTAVQSPTPSMSLLPPYNASTPSHSPHMSISSSLDYWSSTVSLSSEASSPSTRSSGGSSWWESTEDDAEAVAEPSCLAEECLEYLTAHHSALAVRAQNEEEALRGFMPATAERLVRLLGAELGMCKDTSLSASSMTLTPRSQKHLLYQPLVFSGEVPFFHELFCRGLNLLSKTRLEMRARTQRDQDKVLLVVQRQLRVALNAQVTDWDQMDRWFSELPYSAVVKLWEKEVQTAEQDTMHSCKAVEHLRKRLGDGGVRGAPGLRQLVRQQRLSALRAGAKFERRPRGKRDSTQHAWVWLGRRDAALQHADCHRHAAGLADVTAVTQSVELAAVTHVLVGKKCATISGARGRKPTNLDLALSLELKPEDSPDLVSLDLIAPDPATLEAWADGLNLLLDKEYLSTAIKRDLDMLLDMEVRLQLLDLDGVLPPSEPPPVPPLPPNYDFVTD